VGNVQHSGNYRLSSRVKNGLDFPASRTGDAPSKKINSRYINAFEYTGILLQRPSLGNQRI
jgi:hypothetical protein